jgi:hypothetical protein
MPVQSADLTAQERKGKEHMKTTLKAAALAATVAAATMLSVGAALAGTYPHPVTGQPDASTSTLSPGGHDAYNKATARPDGLILADSGVVPNVPINPTG